MSAGYATRQTTRIDLAAFDRLGQPVLLVEVKAMTGARFIALGWWMDLLSDFHSTGLPIPYWMLVDLEEILIFDGDRIVNPTPLVTLITADILGNYDPNFGRKRVFDDYLRGLVEAWLQDFAFEWKSVTPPAQEQLAAIGLAERLRGGATHREVSFADRDPVRRDQPRAEPRDGT